MINSFVIALAQHCHSSFHSGSDFRAHHHSYADNASVYSVDVLKHIHLSLWCYYGTNFHIVPTKNFDLISLDSRLSAVYSETLSNQSLSISIHFGDHLRYLEQKTLKSTILRLQLHKYNNQHVRNDEMNR